VLQGQIAEGRIPEILRSIYLDHLSGLLCFRNGGVQIEVRFHKGRIVGGTSNAFGNGFGEVIVRDGLLGAEQWQEANSIAKITGVQVVTILEELGTLTRERFDDALALYIRELLLEVFAWGQGEYIFEEHPPSTVPEATLKISTAETILEAVRHVHSEQAIHNALGDTERVPILSTDPLLRFQHVTLTPVDGFLLSRIDGVTSAREIIAIAPLPVPEAERSLFGLLCIGLVEFLPAWKPAKVLQPKTSEAPDKISNVDVQEVRQRVIDIHANLKSRDHYAVLGVKPTAEASEIKAAYFSLAKMLHPDAHHIPELSDLREQFDSVYMRLSEAYDVLSHPERKAAYDARMMKSVASAQTVVKIQAPAVQAPQLSPEKALEEAEQLYGDSKPWEAIGILHGVINIAEGALKQRMRILRAQAYLKNPSYVKQATEELQLAVQEDPNNAQAHYLLGKIYRDAKLVKRAAAAFRKTLEIKPNHKDARYELEQLGGDKP
jgi:curved DNA-binding protein CbpA